MTSNSFLCVGIDPTPALVEQLYPQTADRFLDFCKSIVEIVAPYCCALKTNHAFFGAVGQEQQLATFIRWVHAEYPGLPVILDAKRNDIGSSSARYAYEAFHRFEADAVTVNAFMGWDTVEPFLSYEEKGVFILCRTSNPGSNWIQTLGEPEPVYLRIANHVQRLARENTMLVVGATHLDALERVRQTAPDVWLLIPGVGAQGGDTAEVRRLARRQDGLGIVVNCSRGITQHDVSAEMYLHEVEQSAVFWNRALVVKP